MATGWGRTLGALGTVSYNGFEFPSALTVQVKCVPVYTKDGRIVKYVRYTLSIECIITAEDLDPVTAKSVTSLQSVDGVANTATSFSIQELRQVLTQAGGVLEISGHGFGNISVFTRSTDYEFGPKPKIAEYRLAGLNNAIGLVWEVDFTSPTCDVTPGSEFIAEYSWGVTFDINEAGLTTRTISGYIERIIHRTADGKYIDGTVDEFRSKEILKFPLIPGFRRTQRYEILPDKRGMNFSVVDTEIDSDNPFFERFIEIDMDFELSSRAELVPGKPLPWLMSLFGKFRFVPGTKRTEAWVAFLIVLNSRFKRLQNFKPNEDSDETPYFLMILAVNFKESIFKRSVEFGVTWTASLPLKDLLKASGIWMPVPGTDWTKWQSSIPHGSMGWQGLGHSPADDIIISVCQPGRPNPKSIKKEKDPYPSPINPLAEQCKDKKEDETYIAYRLGAEYIKSDKGVVHTALVGGDGGAQIDVSDPRKIKLNTDSLRQQYPNIYQDRGSARWFLVLYGFAERLCYPAVAPVLESVSSQKPKVRSQSVKPSLGPIKKSASGLPVYRTDWSIIYELDGKELQQYNLKDVPKKYENQIPKPP